MSIMTVETPINSLTLSRMKRQRLEQLCLDLRDLGDLRAAELQGRLDKAIERMNRARKLIQESQGGNWGMLDTSDLEVPRG